MSNDEKQNSVTELSKYFGTTAKEFMEFWKTLSEEEKEYYKNADLN